MKQKAVPCSDLLQGYIGASDLCPKFHPYGVMQLIFFNEELSLELLIDWNYSMNSETKLLLQVRQDLASVLVYCASAVNYNNLLLGKLCAEEIQ